MHAGVCMLASSGSCMVDVSAAVHLITCMILANKSAGKSSKAAVAAPAAAATAAAAAAAPPAPARAAAATPAAGQVAPEARELLSTKALIKVG